MLVAPYKLERATAYSAGVDVRSIEDIDINPGSAVVIDTGVKLDKVIPELYYELHIRHSIARKGLTLTNSVGIIDMDYKESICMMITNNSGSVFKVKKGDKLGQLILKRHEWDTVGFKGNDVDRTWGFYENHEEVQVMRKNCRNCYFRTFVNLDGEFKDICRAGVMEEIDDVFTRSCERWISEEIGYPSHEAPVEVDEETNE